MTPQEAIEAAREMLGHWFAKSPDGIAYGRWFRRMEIHSLARLQDLCDPGKQVVFAKQVEDARKGEDPEADALLCEWGALAVSYSGSIPLPLRNYIADRLLEQAESGRRKRGRHPDDLLPRDFAITYAIARVHEHGFSPTRNPAHAAQESACSIVTEALKRINIHMSEDNVEKIWGRRSQLPEALREYVAGEARIPNSTL